MQIIRDKTTKAIIRISPTPIRIDGMIPPDLDAALELVDVIEAPAQPGFNPVTQKVVPVSSEQAGAVGFPIRLVNDWSVVSLTQPELDAVAAQAASAAERDQAKAMVAKLRNPGSDTNAQILDRLQRGLARVITDLYK